MSQKIAVLGAGANGASIGADLTRAGLDVVLIDQTQEAADKGKAYSEELMKKAMSRGRATQTESDALLARIAPV